MLAGEVAVRFDMLVEFLGNVVLNAGVVQMFLGEDAIRNDGEGRGGGGMYLHQA
jgi:hypothetical protein